MAGCMAALLLLRTGVICWSGVEAASTFLPAQATSAAHTEIGFPTAIPGTDLLAMRLGCYEGPFLEDGTGRNVFNTALLEVKNTGSCMIRRAVIRLAAGECAYVFELTFLPPGETVLVLEKNGRPCGEAVITEIEGTQENAQKDTGLSEFSVTDLQIGMTRITNRSAKDFSDLRIYYKSSLGEDAYLVGGITHTYPLQDLKAGESVIVNLPNYAMGGSRIVAIQ